MHEDSDIAIIQSVLNGQTNDFGTLIDKYQDQVYRLCLRITRNTEEAGEAAHLTFIKAYKSLGGFRQHAKFSTWLFRIAYNTCISGKRVENRFNREVLPEEQADLNPDELNEGINYLTRSEQQQYIAKALNELHAEEVVLIEGYYLEEMSITELKEMTGLSESNIKVKLHRARKKMYITLEGLLKEELVSLIR